MFEPQQLARVDLGGRELEGERAVDVRRGDQLHALQRLDAALRLLRLGGLGAEAVDVRAQVRDLPLLLDVRRLLQRERLRVLALEGRVVAAVGGQLLPSTCTIRVTTASRKSRSWVISSSVPG